MTVERDHHGFDAPAPLGHPGRIGLPDGHSTGPEVGERLPDFVLPDAHGRLVDYHASRGHAKSVVVFYRSAVWWPPCWTQLGELRDAYEKFRAAGIELYAISYDDQEMLSEFSEKQNIPYRLLSDIDSEVIGRYGILNDQIGRGDAILEGIPYPGVYVTDEEGIVVAKFFHDTYKKRDSPETLIDAALGRLVLSDDAPSVRGGDEEVRISASVHGGKGTIRQGILRKLVVRFELGEGVHIYGEPVPEGMIPTTVSVSGPPGLVVQDPVFPPTETLRLASMDMELPVWSGTVDVVVPFYAVGELASETRPLDVDTVEVEIGVRYQACDDAVCFPPKTEKLVLQLELDVMDVPAIANHRGHGQRKANFSGAPHVARLVLRKARKNPLGLPRYLFKTMMLEIAAKRRSLQG